MFGRLRTLGEMIDLRDSAPRHCPLTKEHASRLRKKMEFGKGAKWVSPEEEGGVW